MMEIIRAEIIRDDYLCGGFKASGLPELCRKLVEAGCNPATRLEAFRGETLGLKVRSIGEAAKLEIAGSGVGYRRPGRASPVSDRACPVDRQPPPEQKSHLRARTPRGSQVLP
jgi:hypothetical protein